MDFHPPSHYIRQKQPKKIWTSKEDDMLRSLVGSYGTGNWSVVSESLPGRTGKQCRERWLNHLGSGIKKGNWTEEEDRTITTTRLAIGNQWSKITKMLPGRTDNAVKNRYHAMQRAEIRGKITLPDFYDHRYFLFLVSQNPHVDFDLQSNPHPPEFDPELPYGHTRHVYSSAVDNQLPETYPPTLSSSSSSSSGGEPPQQLDSRLWNVIVNDKVYKEMHNSSP